MEPELNNPQFLMALLALEQKLISQDELLVALRTWLANPSKPLSEILVEQAGTKAELASVFQQQVIPADITQSLLQIHDQNETSSLDAALGEIQKLVVDSPDLRQTLLHVEELFGKKHASTESGSEHTARSKMIGNYKLLQKIGEGGMGTVWMAEQEKPVRRRVALKLIKAGADDQQVIARFEAERQALAMMDHLNIARVLDAGATPTGQPFCVMELVQGIPITEYCDKHRLSLRERLELFVPVCHAVQHAHQKGIIHRDLKPSNVLVAQYDGKPVPKVIDFGLAKALQHQTKLSERTMFTEFGQVVGTLRYMSPEQAELNALDIDTRTDIYSLGVMLYELLTGSTPLEKDSVDKEPIFKVLEAIRAKDPPRPSTRLSSVSVEAATGISQQRQIDSRKLQKILRGELDWIVMKAIEKDRSRRFGTASDFAEDIERYLSGNAVHARPPSVAYQARKFVKRHRGLIVAITAISISLLTGLVGIAWFAFDAKMQRERTYLAMNQTKIEKEAKNAESEARKKAETQTQIALESTALAKENAQEALASRVLAERARQVAEEYKERAMKAEAESSMVAKASQEDSKRLAAMISSETSQASELNDVLLTLLQTPLVSATEQQADIPRTLARRMFIASTKLQARSSQSTAQTEALLWSSIINLGYRKEGMRAIDAAIQKHRELKTKDPVAFVQWSLDASNGLINAKQFDLAEPLLREGLAVCESLKKDNLFGNTQDARHVKLSLATSLLGQKKYTESEQLLVQTYAEIEQQKATLPKTNHPLIIPIADRFIELYTATNKPDEVAKWKQIRNPTSANSQ